MNLKHVFIDFTKCKYAQDLYETTIKAMHFPDWCGKNLDAIWDMLKGSDEITIYFKGMERLPKDLRQEALEIFTVFAEAEQRAHQIHSVID